VKPAKGAVAARDVTGRPLAFPIPSRTRVWRSKSHLWRRRWILKGKRKGEAGSVKGNRTCWYGEYAPGGQQQQAKNQQFFSVIDVVTADDSHDGQASYSTTSPLL